MRQNLKRGSLWLATSMALTISVSVHAADAPYPVPDTNQDQCFDARTEITCPQVGETFFGQDAQHKGTTPAYRDNGDGTVTDLVTGLVWMKTPDLNGDGTIDYADKRTYDEAAAQGESFSHAGYDDWRLPTIKELYSLMDFSGTDPAAPSQERSTGSIPFIDTDYFGFAYGDLSAGEREIDAQWATSSLYVSGTGPQNGRTMFGVNFADGRIKGYGLQHPRGEKKFYVMYVRGEQGYGINHYADNGDGTITDGTTGLMWSQTDSGEALNWDEALSWVGAMNEQNYLGHDDWRLPNAKELQIIVDYGRAPDTSRSAAIDPIFEVSEIVNENGEADYPAYWSSTTHISAVSDRAGASAAYVNFGRSMGNMGGWVDIHGAGAQRSDPKEGDPDWFANGRGPQGDAIRIYNYARLVRDA